MFYIIYKTTNVVNGKFYIGKHKTKRLDDGYMGSGKILKHAISKYGLDNFHKEILHVCESEKQMNALEKILVVPDPEINYNLCPGGHGGFGYINALPETREKLKRNYQISLSKGFDKLGRVAAWEKAKDPTVFSKREAKRKTTLKNRYGSEGVKSFLGKEHSLETKKKMSKAAHGKHNGAKNSQFGTMWITNGVENKKIRKEVDIIPEGWYKGRKIMPL